MWKDSTFARWEVAGEARERIKAAHREAEQRRLAKLARGAGTRTTSGSLLSSALAVLEWLASSAQPKQRPAHP
jgi:hypothetical protein